jgi:hypothetical protein
LRRADAIHRAMVIAGVLDVASQLRYRPIDDLKLRLDPHLLSEYLLDGLPLLVALAACYIPARRARSRGPRTAGAAEDPAEESRYCACANAKVMRTQAITVVCVGVMPNSIRRWFHMRFGRLELQSESVHCKLGVNAELQSSLAQCGTAGPESARLQFGITPAFHAGDFTCNLMYPRLLPELGDAAIRQYTATDYRFRFGERRQSVWNAAIVPFLRWSSAAPAVELGVVPPTPSCP